MTHAQEHLLQTFDFNGAEVALVAWTASLWCGKIAYATGNTGEPDVEALAQAASELFSRTPPFQREAHWEACLSLNYLSEERPCGVMFGFLTDSPGQPEGYDLLEIPAGTYMKLAICDATASALGVQPWTGGIPPYEWIHEIIAPRLGYRSGSCALPIIEYYRHNPVNGQVEACDLYVPVQRA